MFLQTEMPASSSVQLTLPVAPKEWDKDSDEIPLQNELPDMNQYRQRLQSILQKQSPLHARPHLIPGSPQTHDNPSAADTGQRNETSENQEVDTEKTTSELDSSDK